MATHFVTFINNSPLPINIETWQPHMFGFLSEMKTQTVKPGEKISMGSETGEWETNTYLYDKTMCDEWIAAGYEKNLGQVIGKFRDEPCIKGEYTWLYNNDFEIVYNSGTVTFSKK